MKLSKRQRSEERARTLSQEAVETSDSARGRSKIVLCSVAFCLKYGISLFTPHKQSTYKPALNIVRSAWQRSHSFHFLRIFSISSRPVSVNLLTSRKAKFHLFTSGVSEKTAKNCGSEFPRRISLIFRPICSSKIHRSSRFELSSLSGLFESNVFIISRRMLSLTSVKLSTNKIVKLFYAPSVSQLLSNRLL